MPCIDLRSFLSDTKSSECIGAGVGRGIPTIENKGVGASRQVDYLERVVRPADTISYGAVVLPFVNGDGVAVHVYRHIDAVQFEGTIYPHVVVRNGQHTIAVAEFHPLRLVVRVLVRQGLDVGVPLASVIGDIGDFGARGVARFVACHGQHGGDGQQQEGSLDVLS